MCFKFLLAQLTIFPYVVLFYCCSRQTRVQTGWLQHVCVLYDWLSAVILLTVPKNESQTKEVKFHFAILLVVHFFWEGGVLILKVADTPRLRKDRLTVRGKPGTDTSQYCDYQNKQLTGIAYQRISLGSQLAPRIWERTERVCTKELNKVSKETLLKIN